jgi:FixJ family two-component response regulator
MAGSHRVGHAGTAANVTGTVSSGEPVISIIDDDESVRESLPDLLREMGYAAQVFASADAFLAAGTGPGRRILLLDVAMPGMSGFELQEALSARGDGVRIIFMTGRVDERIRQRVLAAGAVACLFKPFTESDLASALGRALAAE